MRQLLALFVVCAMFVFGVRPAFAQAGAQEAAPVVEPTTPLVDIEAAGTSLLETVAGIVNGGIYTLGLSPLVVLLVGLLKYVPMFYKESPDDSTGVSAPALAFTVSVVLWGIAAAATLAGYTAQFNSFRDWIIASLPYILGLLATLGLAPALHEQMARSGVSIMGSKRSPELAVVEAINGGLMTQSIAYPSLKAEIDEGHIESIVDRRIKQALDKAGVNEFNWTPTNSTEPIRD